MFERSDASRLSALPAAVRHAFASLERYYAEHRLQINCLAIIAASAFLVRYLTLLGNPAPPGADYGNYLTNLHAAEGNDVTGGGVQYPAIFIGYLWIMVLVFGELPALLISGPLLAAIICVPSYLLMRHFARPVFALFGAATLTFGEWASEMIGWGGNPNLLGILFGTFFMAFLANYLRGGGRRDLVLSAVFLALTAGSHQISVVVYAVAAVFAIAIARATSPNRHILSRGSRAMLTGIACSVPFVPFYLSFVQASPGVPLLSPTPITIHDLLFIFDWFFRESLALWIPLIAAAVVGYRRLLRNDPLSFAIGLSLVASPLVLMETIMSQHPVRPIYFLPFGIVPGAVAFLQTTADDVRAAPHLSSGPTTPRAILLAAVLTAALILMSSSQARMEEASQWYTVATPQFLDVMRWIDANTPTSAIIATSGPGQYGQELNTGCQWGWWIEGYAQRQSLCTADLQFLEWEPQVVSSAAADRAFAGVVSFENGWIRVGDFAPYGGLGNPIVSGDFGLGYQAFAYFDDARVVAVWPAPGTGMLQSASAQSLTTRTATHASNESVTLTSVGTGTGISITRAVTLSSDSSLVWTNYSFEASGNLSQISVSVFGTSNAMVNDFDRASMTLDIGSASGFRQYAAGSVQIRTGAQDLSRADLSANPQSGISQAALDFAPTGRSFNLSFAVTASVDRALPATGVRAYSAHQVLSSASVAYVLVDKARVRDYEWITADQSDFQLAYANAGIALFSVVG